MNILEKEGISPPTLGVLQFIGLNKGQDDYILDIVKVYVFEYKTDSGNTVSEILEKANLIRYIKTGRKDPWYRIRLSKKGEDILREMTQKPLHDLAQITLDFIEEEYLRIGADKLISKGPKLLFYISEFLYNKSKYTEPMIKAVIRAYVGTFEYDTTYMNAMKTLFFKPTNAYATKWDSESCPLSTFIQKNDSLIKHTYKQWKNK